MHLKLKVGLRPVWQLDWLGWESVSHPTHQSPGELHLYLPLFKFKINFLCLDCRLFNSVILYLRVVFHSTAILLHLSRDSGWRFVFRNVLCPGTWNILCHSQLGARDCSAVVKSSELAKYLKYSLEALTKSGKLKFKIQRCLSIKSKNVSLLALQLLFVLKRNQVCLFSTVNKLYGFYDIISNFSNFPIWLKVALDMSSFQLNWKVVSISGSKS